MIRALIRRALGRCGTPAMSPARLVALATLARAEQRAATTCSLTRPLELDRRPW